MSENRDRIRPRGLFQPNAKSPDLQLSIYPQPDKELVLVQTHSVLEEHITAARRAATSTYQDARSRVQSVVDRWIGVEHAVERRVKSIIPVDESLTPGALYAGVATLTASILARNRSILLRFSLPPVFLFISMNQFLPKTSRNLASYFSSLERAHAPALADAHEQLNQSIVSTSEAARDAWIRARNRAVGGVERTVTELQGRTGLKLRDALGWSEGAVGKAEVDVKVIANRVENNVDDLAK